MKLDLSSLRKAIDSLERTLNVAQDESLAAELDDDVTQAIRAGVIQNFEFAYELCWKFIRRWLRENAQAEETEHPRTRKEVFRLAARYGLVRDPLSWFAHSDARNLTLHTYDEATAESVCRSALDFLEDAKYLLVKLQEHNE